MYAARMREELDVDKEVAAGNFAAVNHWMAEHVWKKADLLAPSDWILDITGKELSPDAFPDYLEKKYSKIYELS